MVDGFVVIFRFDAIKGKLFTFPLKASMLNGANDGRLVSSSESSE